MKLLIKELREAKGMTQKELADLMQVSFQTVSKWENNINYPDITQIPKLADVFGVSADVLLGMKPLHADDAPVKYDEVTYWNQKRDVLKVWKQFYWNEDYFRFFVREVLRPQKATNVLDFGCGYGYLGQVLLPLLPAGSSYSGIELDQDQIKEAMEYFSETPYQHEFFEENIYDWRPAKQYDLVVALFLLSNMQNPQTVLEKMKQSLTPGGTILLMDANEEVEQAGYYSGLEKQEGGMRQPDFVPLWEDELARGERDYRCGTKLPYLLKQAGFRNIQARISDQVIIYEPSDPSRKHQGDDFRYVYSNQDARKGGVGYFLNHGYSLQRANEVTTFYQKTSDYFDRDDSIAVKTSGVYFVYATL